LKTPMPNPTSLTLILFAVCALSSTAAWAKEPGGYHLAKKVSVPGAGTYYDYLAFDPATRRLYVSFGGEVVILDGDKDLVVGALPGGKKIHGMVVANGRVFVTDGGADLVRVYDAGTQKPLGEVKTGKNPDAITYDPASKQVLAFNHSGGSVTAIDAGSLKVNATIEAPGALEMGRADGQGTAWVNVEDKNEIVRLDTRKNTVTAHWSLKPCEAPTGLAFDPKTRRLFAGCENKLLVVVDADSGKVLTTLPIGPGVDGVEWDPGKRTILASCGGETGSLAVLKQESKDKYAVVTNVATQARAKTLALDPKSHRVFLSAASYAPPADPKARPSIVPGTFNVLIVEP
jgi:YVTN family beta-propeller protein